MVWAAVDEIDVATGYVNLVHCGQCFRLLKSTRRLD